MPITLGQNAMHAQDDRHEDEVASLRADQRAAGSGIRGWCSRRHGCCFRARMPAFPWASDANEYPGSTGYGVARTSSAGEANRAYHRRARKYVRE